MGVHTRGSELRKYVPRGLCICELKPPRQPKRTLILVSAMKKFFGGMGDEDDTDMDNDKDWRRTFLQPVEEATAVVETSKENGEAAHLSVLEITDDLPAPVVLYVCGSKNVHLVAASQKDLTKYAEQRFSVARNVAQTALRLLSSFTEEVRSCIQQCSSE